jgi:hypothetical protein
MRIDDKAFVFKVFFYLLAVESLLTWIFLASFPSDSSKSIFGFSAQRLFLLSGVGILFLTAVFMLIKDRYLSFVDALDRFLGNSNNRLVTTLVSGLIVSLGGIFFLTPSYRLGEAIYHRLMPLVFLAFVIALQIMILQFIWADKKLQWARLKKWITPLKFSGMVILFFILLWVLIAWSGVGIDPEPSGWFAPGSPLLAHQVLFAWVVGLLLIGLGRQYDQGKKMDWIMGGSLWLAAVVIWWMEPMRRWSYFTPKPTPPNFEYYPYSDAAIYDGFAQNILIGISRQLGLTNRPLYSLILSFFHSIGGQDFENIIFLQIMVFAVLPVFTYLLASRLGGRSAGVIAALIVILRERNSIALTNVIEVSHLKLLMSDVPTMTMMLIFMYFFVKWLLDEKMRIYWGVLAGGFFGFTILIRSQSLLLIPIILLGLLLAWKFEWKSFIRNSLVFFVTCFLVVFPWVIRNYQVSGQTVIEYQGFYTKIIASGYSSSPGDIDPLPGESSEEYNARMKNLIVTYIFKNPLEVARFYSSYFIHNEISSVAILPMSLQFFDLYEYVDRMEYWSTPMDGLPRSAQPVFFVTLCVIAVGIGAVFHRYKWVGLMPLLFHLGYSFSVVPVRMSGWRYILPVDWVIFLYFSIGLAQLGMMLFAVLSKKEENVSKVEQNSFQPVQNGRIFFALSAFALIGILFPLVEWSVPNRYPPMSASQMLKVNVPNGLTLENGEQISSSALESFLETETDATVGYGRALYPSYYKEGEFWGESSPNLVEASQFSRLQFNLIGPNRGFIFLPMQDPPQYFPHASDVFIIGCRQRNSIKALIIMVDGHTYNASPWGGLTCSITE